MRRRWHGDMSRKIIIMTAALAILLLLSLLEQTIVLRITDRALENIF